MQVTAVFVTSNKNMNECTMTKVRSNHKCKQNYVSLYNFLIVNGVKEADFLLNHNCIFEIKKKRRMNIFGKLHHG